MLTPQQLGAVIEAASHHSEMAQTWFRIGAKDHARQHAAIARQARRRIRAHVRERRRRLRAVLARSEHNIIGHMMVEQLLRKWMTNA
jgi:alkylation response protein AidB-like acyl-CoA dehydrogenase